jgi:hypothetical protein
MTDKIIIATPPDDCFLDGIRILTVNLSHEQSNTVSQSLMSIDCTSNIICYVWKIGDPIQWLLDKKLKATITIFNADVSTDGMSELITGYIAAQPKTYYFGNLRDLQEANRNVIYTKDDLLSLLGKITD